MMHLVSGFLVCLLACAPLKAQAYGRSEDDEMKEEIHEAVNRARDFTTQRVREATEDLERERGAKDVKKERAEFEAEQEKNRETFVVERNSHPPDTLKEARLEREFDQEKVVEEREMDKARDEYLHKRQKVNAIIRKKAHINENEEYGL